MNVSKYTVTVLKICYVNIIIIKCHLSLKIYQDRVKPGYTNFYLWKTECAFQRSGYCVDSWI